jgi:hypothetical protein
LEDLILFGYHALIDLYFVIVHESGRVADFKSLMDTRALIGGCVLSFFAVISGAE